MSNVLQMVLAPRQTVRERRRADDWLRSSSGVFVPEEYAQRAAELSSPEHRLMLAKTLRKIERSAGERAIGPTNILDLAAVREHRRALRSLVTLLEDDREPVTAAGMLRVRDLITQASSPLYGTTRGLRLDAEIATAIDLLQPRSAEPAAA
jgi:hypothetical protein